MSQRIVSVEPSTLNHHGVVCDLFVYRDASLMVLLLHFSIIYVSNLLFGFIGFRVATCFGKSC